MVSNEKNSFRSQKKNSLFQAEFILFIFIIERIELIKSNIL